MRLVAIKLKKSIFMMGELESGTKRGLKQDHYLGQDEGIADEILTPALSS